MLSPVRLEQNHPEIQKSPRSNRRVPWLARSPLGSHPPKFDLDVDIRNNDFVDQSIFKTMSIQTCENFSIGTGAANGGGSMQN